MSVLTVRESFNGRSDSETVGEETQKTRVFIVRTDNPYDEWSTISTHPSIPPRWSKHPKNNRLIAQTYQCENIEEASCIWRIAVGYSTKKATGTSPESMSQEYDPESVLNPLNIPAEINWDRSQFRKVISKAPRVTGANAFRADTDQIESASNYPGPPESIATSAGVSFTAPVEVDDSRRMVSVMKNISQPYEWMLDMNDCVNDSDFRLDGLLMKKGTVKVVLRMSPRRFDFAIPYRQLYMEFERRREGWDIWLRDEGIYEAVDVPGKFTQKALMRLKDANGNDATEPLKLDGDGRKMADQKEPAYYRVYRHYPFVSFSPLLPYLV